MPSASSCVFREIRGHACSPCNPRCKTFRAGHRPSLSCPASRGCVFHTTRTPPSRCFAESGWLAPHYPPGPRSNRNAASGRRLGIERQGVDQGSACLPTRQGGQAGHIPPRPRSRCGAWGAGTSPQARRPGHPNGSDAKVNIRRLRGGVQRVGVPAEVRAVVGPAHAKIKRLLEELLELKSCVECGGLRQESRRGRERE